MTKHTPKILVLDRLEKDGLALLQRERGVKVDVKLGLSPEKVKAVIADYDAAIVRSGTRFTKDIIDAARNLKVIGRAGVGVDNVDLDAATKRGIIVMNTPEGNTIATAEHTMTLMMALARKIPRACQSLVQGKWKREEFIGTELNGKTLGVIGLGRIGREVAKRAGQGLGMKVIAYDPFITEETARPLGVAFCDLKKLLRESDFITVHTPLTPETKHLINRPAFQLMKKDVRIINCARGGIIDEKALLEAIQSGKVAGAALDVFEKEPPSPKHPLLKRPEVIATPHLGAATREAQENVSVAVVRQVVDALYNRAIRNAVNMPSLEPETYQALRPWIELAEKIGLMHAQLFTGRLREVTVRYCGEVTRYPLTPLTVAVLKGLLQPISGNNTINFVNAPAIARERGIRVVESTTTDVKNFANFIELETGHNHESNRIMGTFFGNDLPRIVRINEFWGLDIDPKNYVLIIRNEDKPGVIGKLGTILGNNKINIAEMSLARIEKGKKTFALTTVNTDQEVPSKVLAEIKNSVLDAKLVKF